MKMEDISLLASPFLAEEVKFAFFGMDPLKTPKEIAVQKKMMNRKMNAKEIAITTSRCVQWMVF